MIPLILMNPLRSALIAGLAASLAFGAWQTAAVHKLEGKLKECRADNRELRADAKELQAANTDLAAQIETQNAAVEALAEKCRLKADDDRRALELLKRGPRINSAATEAQDMNEWLATY
jgi:uncharacterized protein YlxW (UPF0749 family)